eukprot:4796292-Prymnesium_polylepis.1
MKAPFRHICTSPFLRYARTFCVDTVAVWVRPPPAVRRYVCTEAELLDMCRLARERKWWCDSSVVHLRTP